MWESKTDWDIFRDLAKATSEAAKKYLPEPQKDIVAAPSRTTRPGRSPAGDQGLVPRASARPIPGKTMHNLAVVDRDYTKLYDKFITLGDQHPEDRAWAPTATTTSAPTTPTTR